MEDLYVIKIGGNIIDDEAKLSSFLLKFAAIKAKKILVHGGGKMATRVAEAMGIPHQMVDGRRITDAETLKVITMVYAGYINKNIVAKLQRAGCNAIGLSGADGNLIKAHKRTGAAIDYGFVGDIDAVNNKLLEHHLGSGFTPVIAPLTHDGKGSLLNTNADTIAQEIAKALGKGFNVSLIYCFEKDGVLLDAEDDASVISKLTDKNYPELRAKNVISGGMLPKLDNAFAALKAGVGAVIIGNAENLPLLLNQTSGTYITNG